MREKPRKTEKNREKNQSNIVRERERGEREKEKQKKQRET